MRRAVGVFVGVISLVACGCTDIGCPSAVQVPLKSLMQWVGADSFAVELCVGDYCEQQSIDSEKAEQLQSNNQGPLSFDMIPNDVDRDQVLITVTTAEDTFEAESSSIDFDSERPNGAFCGPVCHCAFVDSRMGSWSVDRRPRTVPSIPGGYRLQFQQSQERISS